MTMLGLFARVSDTEARDVIVAVVIALVVALIVWLVAHIVMPGYEAIMAAVTFLIVILLLLLA